MAAIAEILAELRANPKGVRFTDACKVATHFFGEPRQNGTSHKVWKTPWPGDPRINLESGDGGKAKPYQVRQVLAAVDLVLAPQQKHTAEPSGAETVPQPKKQPKKQPKRRK